MLYTLDGPIGWTGPGARWNDACPTPPGPTGDGCVVGARLSRLTAAGDVMTGAEQVFIEDWCQQYPSHSIGSLAMGGDGALYVSGGDGASFTFADWGQDGHPAEPVRRPPHRRGRHPGPPGAEGGALRAQDLETAGDPVTFDGSVLRLDPSTGAALPDNPLFGGASADDDRIVAYGLRNPFRLTVRPGTSEVWVGDVGWNEWEEINRIANPTDEVRNFGWPCYEGPFRQSGYDGANLAVCESLYLRPEGRDAAPLRLPAHATRSSRARPAAPAARPSPGWPSTPATAIRTRTRGRSSSPTTTASACGPCSRDRTGGPTRAARDLRGPGGGARADRRPVRRATSSTPTSTRAPSGASSITARPRWPPGAPRSGPAPLTVSFDGSGSSDPDGDALTFAWDLDGDGAFDDAASAATSLHLRRVRGPTSRGCG